jgi:hypothetical protein
MKNSPCYITDYSGRVPKFCAYDKECTARWEKIGGKSPHTAEKENLLGLPQYIYDRHQGYYKVTNVYANGKFDAVPAFDNCRAVIQRKDFEHYAHARLREFDDREMRDLVGKIITEPKKDSTLLVLAYNNGEDSDGTPAVMMIDEWFSNAELLAKGYTIDNKPCGVFEHFDHVREEWVK